MNDKTSTFTANHDDLEPQLESAVWAVLSERLPADAIARVKSRALALEEKPVPRIRPSTRNISWSRPWMQVASLAACILLVLGATMMFPSSSSAFAQAIEKLKNAGAFRYKELVYVETEAEPIESEVLVADDGRKRESMLGRVSIHDAKGLIRLTFDETVKSAQIHEPFGDEPADSSSELNWLDQLKSYGKNPGKSLGAMMIDGRGCVGHEVNPSGSVTYAVWVDTKTSDLVQVEMKGMPKGSGITKSVMKDFEFNLSLDSKLFSFDVPAGYQATTAEKLPKLLPFEESLVEALKGYTELSGGNFPKSITDWGEWAILMTEKGLAKEKSTTLSARLGTLLPYLTSMSHDDYDYTGAGKGVDEKRSIVFWYRNPEKQLRAVYSDFTVATIAEADLPKK
jgi:outer membrane lipoprotein-sorting protein